MSRKTILIIAGTGDARQIIEELQGMHHLWIHATVATAFGKELLQSYPNITIHSGRRDGRELAELIQQVKAVALIDASHPFAEEVSRNAMNACKHTGIPYLRYEREKTADTGEAIIRVAGFSEAAEQVAAMKGNILLTTGSNHLEVFVETIPDYRTRLYVRVLPESRVLEKCEALGLTARNIIAFKGPFTEAMNMEIYKYCKATVVVTKDSGEAGGNGAKISAAAKLMIPMILITRPCLDYGSKVLSIQEIIEFGKGLEG
jgi:precorrin-6A/cobalt-precorrin-6A reductase